MDRLYNDTNRLIHQIQNELGRAEQANTESAHVVENGIQALIDQMTSNCERLDILVNKEPASRKQNAKLRVDQLKYDCQHYQAALRTIQNKHYMREQEEKEREELLQRSFTTNDDTSVLINHDLGHNTSLRGVHRNMDEMLDQGRLALDNMKDQRSILKTAHRKILDVGNTLGLSNTVMRLIEKRAYQDKFLLFGGMLVTCIIMFLAYKYLT